MARTLKRARAQAVKKNDKDTKKKPTKTIDGSKVPALGKRHSNRTRVQAALHQAPNFLVLFWKFHFCSVLIALEEGITIAFPHPVVDLTLLPLLSLSLSLSLKQPCLFLFGDTTKSSKSNEDKKSILASPSQIT